MKVFYPKKFREEKILKEISKNEKTTILYESPHRLIKLLNQLKEICGGERQIKVSRELTKKFEEQIGDNIQQVIDFFKDKEILGEITIVIKGLDKSITEANIDNSELKKELHYLTKAGLSLSAASKYLAKRIIFLKVIFIICIKLALKMLFAFRKMLFTLIFNFSLLLLLMVSIQNSTKKEKVNLIFSETVTLPISFIIGISFIGGSITGSLLTINSKYKE